MGHEQEKFRKFWRIFTRKTATTSGYQWRPSLIIFYWKIRNVSFPGSWKTGTGFSQPRVHTVMVGRVPAGHEFLPITVWTSGWENQFQFPNFLEEAFSDITVISQQISSLWKCTKFHHQEIHFPNKENKSPGGIPPGDLLSLLGKWISWWWTLIDWWLPPGDSFSQ